MTADLFSMIEYFIHLIEIDIAEQQRGNSATVTTSTAA